MRTRNRPIVRPCTEHRHSLGLILLAPVLVGSLSAAAAAQLSEQEALRAAQSVEEAQGKAEQKKDATAVSALFTEDAIQVTPQGINSGRAAIEKYYAEVLKVYTADIGKVEQVIQVGDGIMLGMGSWSGTYHSPDGPVRLAGYWSEMYVRDGNTWKVRQETFNNAPPPPEAKI